MACKYCNGSGQVWLMTKYVLCECQELQELKIDPEIMNRTSKYMRECAVAFQKLATSLQIPQELLDDNAASSMEAGMIVRQLIRRLERVPERMLHKASA